MVAPSHSMAQNAFQQRRKGILAGLAANAGDKSRKGSVDVRALGVITALNARPDMYTTSSCSGRISVFAEPTEETRLAGKRGGEWVYASHDPADEAEVLACLHKRCISGAQLVFRFEPFLLHAECVDMAAANQLLNIARLAGFRESGATQGSSSNTRIMVGVRCALRLEVPVADAGVMLVTDEYIRYLVRLANHKFALNTARIQRLEELLIAANQPPPTPLPPAAPGLDAVPQQGPHRASQAVATQRTAADAAANGHHPVPANGHAAGPAARASSEQVINSNGGASRPSVMPTVEPHGAALQGVVGSVARRKGLRGVDAALHSPLQALRARQVALLKRLSELQQRLAATPVAATTPSAAAGQQAGYAVPAGSAPSAAAAAATPAAGRGAAAAALTPPYSSSIQQHLLQQQEAGSTTQAPADGSTANACGTHLTSPCLPGQLAWVPMAVEQSAAFDPESLLRWGAASVTWRGQLVVVGGYGGAGTHARRADVLLCSTTSSATTTSGASSTNSGSSGSSTVSGSSTSSGSSTLAGQQYRWRVLEPPAGSATPSPRMGHAMTLIGDYLVLVGGRASPASPLSDVWLLHLPTATWAQVHPTVLHAPRAPVHDSHAAATAHVSASHATGHDSNAAATAHDRAPGNTAHDSGLRATGDDRATATVLHLGVEHPNPGSATATAGQWPGRYRHSATAVGSPASGQLPTCVYVFGGRGEEQVLDDLWVLLPPVELAGLNGGMTAGLATGWRWVQVPKPERAPDSLTPPATGPASAPGPVAASGAAAAAGAGAGDSCSPASPCWPAPRKSHAAAALHGCLYLHGGMAAYGSHQQDLYCLDVSAVQQYIASRSLSRSSDPAAQAPANVWYLLCPTPTHQHSASSQRTSGQTLQAVGQGGASCSEENGDGGGCVCAPPAAMSHTLTPLGPHHLLLAGGHPTSLHDWLHVFDTRACEWRRWRVAHPDLRHPSCLAAASWLPIRHCTGLLTPVTQPSHTLTPSSPSERETTSQQLVVVGGGAFCFSFGSVFSGPFVCDLTPVTKQLGISTETTTTPVCSGPTQQGAHAAAATTPAATTPAAATSAATSGAAATPAYPQRSTAQGPGPADWVLQLPARSAKPVKDALKSVGWLDVRRKGGEVARLAAQGLLGGSPAQPGSCLPAAGLPAASPVLPDEGGTTQMVVLPLMAQAVQPLSAAAEAVQSGVSTPEVAVPAAVVEALRAGAALLQLRTAANPKAVTDPASQMREAVRALLPAAVSAETAAELLVDLPRKWEKLGADLVLVPEDCLRHAGWATWFCTETARKQLYGAVAAALGAQRLARQAPIANTGTRDSQAVLLLGDDGWVQHQEHGVTYVLDVTRCMYSSGNVTERGRMGHLRCEGEVVVDMFTGIGYYTLPLLVNAHAAKVYTCEWNPAALECLRRGLAANGVAHKCDVRAGDCREVAPRGMAHRVLLGLLPHSRLAWPAAVAALRDDTGGWLHVHNNVLDSEEARWVADMVAELQRLCHACPGRRAWSVEVRHVERVKWYAPHIRHIVCDVLLRPPPASAPPPVQLASSVASPALGSAAKSVSPGQHLPSPLQQQQQQQQQAGMAGSGSVAGSTRGSPGAAARLLPSEVAAAGGAAARRAVPAAEVPWFQQPVHQLPRVAVMHGITREVFEAQVSPARTPVLLTGLDLGPALTRWDPHYLAHLPGDYNPMVSVHVTIAPSGAMDFVHKNFVYRTMPWRELVERVTGSGGPHTPLLPPAPSTQHGQPGSVQQERYYLRCLGDNPRKDVADMSRAFPSLWQDLRIPDLFPLDALFSSVLRLSSPGLQLWTHYDVMDNLLIQVKGVKRVLLWPPLCADALYVQGSSSPITQLENPDLATYPRFVEAVPQVVELHPGQVLFIPALWHHHVTTLTPQQLQQEQQQQQGQREQPPPQEQQQQQQGQHRQQQEQQHAVGDNGWSVSVNVFWRHLGSEHYDKKDVYGNKDLVQAALASKAVQEARQHLGRLPEPYRSFYQQMCVRQMTAPSTAA